jgi:hypothetical protein
MQCTDCGGPAEVIVLTAYLNAEQPATGSIAESWCRTCGLVNIAGVGEEHLLPLLALLRTAQDERNDWRGALDHAVNSLAEMLHDEEDS